MSLALGSIALRGLQAARDQLDGAAGRIASRAATGIDQPVRPSLAEDLVAQREAAVLYRANLGVLRTEQAMLGTLVDLRA